MLVCVPLPVQETGSSTEVLPMAQRMLAIARPAVLSQQLSLFLVDRARHQLWCACSVGSPASVCVPSGARLPSSRGVLGYVVGAACPLRLSTQLGDVFADSAMEDKLG